MALSVLTACYRALHTVFARRLTVAIQLHPGATTRSRYRSHPANRWSRPFLTGLIGLAALFPVAGPASASGTILVYGDSLSAAYGISHKSGWATLLQERLRRNGLDYRVANASISGETSSGGATRIAATLAQHKPQLTIVALGSNDGLRGLPVSQLRDNLARIIRATRATGSKVVLVGMRMPPNYGGPYATAFENTYRSLAREFKLPLVPFLLEGLADKPELFQPDQLHPVVEAQPLLLDNVWKVLAPALK
ncbi:MAG: arylesterase [Betaproteobacteria bacterium]|nr:arylesterase [Betaproteobacteria bacterium]